MKNYDDTIKEKCTCESHYGLFLPNRQLSALIAGLLFLFFAFFMAGYFLGKKYNSEECTEMLNQKMRKQIIDDTIENNIPLEKAESINVVDLPAQPTGEQDSRAYCAALIGFGTEKAAIKFKNQLATKNIPTIVKKHSSKTAKGRISYWYQVVTMPYHNRQELQRIVDRIIKEERLKDVIISRC